MITMVTTTTTIREIPILPYRPGGNDIDRWFSPVAAGIMRYLWDIDTPQAATQILRWYRDTVDADMKRHTLVDVLTHLYTIGVLRITRSHGRDHYTPVCDLAKFERAQVAGLVRSLGGPRRVLLVLELEGVEVTPGVKEPQHVQTATDHGRPAAGRGGRRKRHADQAGAPV